MSVDAQTFKQVMSKWASGVTVITTKMPDGAIHGFTASSFTSLSLDPLLILVCINKKAFSHDLVQESGVFAVNILGSGQAEYGKLFAGMYPEITDRFANIDYTTAKTGAPLLPNVLGWLDCTVYTQHDGGDHTIFLGQVQAANASTTEAPAPILYFNRQWGDFTPKVE